MARIFAFIGIIILTGRVYAADLPRIYEWDPASLAHVKEQWSAHDASVTTAVKTMIDRVDKSLSAGPFSVMKKAHPIPAFEPHDYVSLAPYEWPNSKTPDHLPYVGRDGERNPEVDEYDVDELNGLARSVYPLGLAYYFTGDEKYANRAAVLLRAWFLDPATKMNPNFDHAQMVKGKDQGRGTGIIESLRLIKAVDAAGLIAGSKAWTNADQAALQEWFKQFTNWLQTSKNGRAEGAAKNNHGTWYDVQVVTYALFTGDDALAKKVLAQVGPKRVASQIEPDGRQPLEMKRTRSLHYHIYNVQAFVQLADMARQVDMDLWHFSTPDHRSIRTAIDFLIPLVTREKKWEAQEIGPPPEGELFIDLRRAGQIFGDEKYNHAAAKVPNEGVLTELEGMQYAGKAGG
jgi:hypothetical protein